MEKGSLKPMLLLLLSALLAEDVPGAKKAIASPPDTRDVEGCNDFSPFSCPDAPYTCNPGGEVSRFTCIDDPALPPKAFDCDYESEFDCAGMYFSCTGDFGCTGPSSFHCGAEIFDCNSLTTGEESAKFDCNVGSGKTFQCTNDRTYDFMCDRQAIGHQQGFTCEDDAFECSPKHIFRCYSTFHCPASHTCKPPRTECEHEIGWAPPPGEDDDGTAGDFDCFDFGCGNSQPGIPEEKFDCQAGSQFKCLDGGEGLFSCGDLSRFECGEEHEGFVCHDYDCANAFRCTEAFICGDLTGTLPFECSGTTPETAFSCLAIPMPLPGWLTYDCGGGPSWEHCFKCHDTPWPTESFKCPAFNCNGVFHP